MGICLGTPLIVQFTFDIDFPWWSYCFFLAGARLAYCQLRDDLISSRRYESGADGEDRVWRVLETLPENWHIERNVRAVGLGDIDFFVKSPEGKAFTIEAKAHKGEVIESGGFLKRRRRGKEEHFEKDILHQSRKQACYMHNNRHPGFVTALLVFTRAKVRLQDRCIKNVHVLEVGELTGFLMQTCKERETKNKPYTVKLAHLKAQPGLLPLSAKTSRRKPAGNSDPQPPVSSIPDSCNDDSSWEILETAAITGAGTVKKPYKSRLHECWSCKKKILVFTWPGHANWTTERPPEPRPKSIQWKWSSSAECKYWANTCLRCGAVQGDYFVHDEPTVYQWQDIEIFGTH